MVNKEFQTNKLLSVYIKYFTKYTAHTYLYTQYSSHPSQCQKCNLYRQFLRIRRNSQNVLYFNRHTTAILGDYVRKGLPQK